MATLALPQARTLAASTGLHRVGPLGLYSPSYAVAGVYYRAFQKAADSSSEWNRKESNGMRERLVWFVTVPLIAIVCILLAQGGGPAAAQEKGAVSFAAVPGSVGGQDMFGGY